MSEVAGGATRNGSIVSLWGILEGWRRGLAERAGGGLAGRRQIEDWRARVCANRSSLIKYMGDLFVSSREFARSLGTMVQSAQRHRTQLIIYTAVVARTGTATEYKMVSLLFE